MDRRSFVKTIGLTPLLGLIKNDNENKSSKIEKTNFRADNNVCNQGWDSGTSGFFDMPETIVSAQQYQGKLLVFCEHSIWELEIDSEGQPVRKLLSRV